MPIASDRPRSELRSIRWKHPPSRRYPLAIETAIARIGDATAAPHCARYRELFADAPVPGKVRERAKRSDGATNVGSLLQAMIAAADIGRGLVATPVGDRWERKTYYDLDGLAYGPQVADERSFRRTERAAAQLVALGLVQSVPWRVHTAAGVRSTPGLKFITEKCWRLLGVLGMVRAERRRRERERGEQKAAEIVRLVGGGGRRPRAGNVPVAAAASSQLKHVVAGLPQAPPRPRAAGPTPAAEAAIASLRALLDD
ncbi:MAG: hypothetical protein RL684_855 [Pseudomonadota bacterium]|jgi:hypothetical protein